MIAARPVARAGRGAAPLAPVGAIHPGVFAGKKKMGA